MTKKPITNFQEATISLQILTMAAPGRMGKSGEGIISVTYMNDGMWSEPESTPYILVEMHTYPFGEMPRTTKIGAFDTEADALAATIGVLAKCQRWVDVDRLYAEVERHIHPYDLGADAAYETLYEQVAAEVREKHRLIREHPHGQVADGEEELSKILQPLLLADTDTSAVTDVSKKTIGDQMQKIAQNSVYGHTLGGISVSANGDSQEIFIPTDIKRTDL